MMDQCVSTTTIHLGAEDRTFSEYYLQWQMISVATRSMNVRSQCMEISSTSYRYTNLKLSSMILCSTISDGMMAFFNQQSCSQ